MNRLACAALMLLAAAAPAAAQRRCPDGRSAVVTGEPFHPIGCLSGSPSAPQPAKDALPVADAARADLKPLDGAWHGVVTFELARFDVTLTVSGRGERWQWRAIDDRTHFPQELDAAVSRGLFSRPPFKVTLKSPLLPSAPVTGRLWLGAAPLEGGHRPPFDRMAVWTFDGRAPLQQLAYTVDKDRLRGSYTITQPDGTKTSTGVDFARVPEPKP